VPVHLPNPEPIIERAKIREIEGIVRAVVGPEIIARNRSLSFPILYDVR
jgi:hypothetical protein